MFFPLSPPFLRKRSFKVAIACNRHVPKKCPTQKTHIYCRWSPITMVLSIIFLSLLVFYGCFFFNLGRFQKFWKKRSPIPKGPGLNCQPSKPQLDGPVSSKCFWAMNDWGNWQWGEDRLRVSAFWSGKFSPFFCLKKLPRLNLVEGWNKGGDALILLPPSAHQKIHCFHTANVR